MTRLNFLISAASFFALTSGAALASDGVQYPYGPESICGPTADFQKVERYDGTLGVPVEFVDSRERAVGQIQWNATLDPAYDDAAGISGLRGCTGTLVSENLFLTAAHCFDYVLANGAAFWPTYSGTATPLTAEDTALEMHVNFNYQENASGTLQTETSVDIVALTEISLGGLDYALVELEGQPGVEWGFTPISPVDAAVDDTVAIIQHPSGRTKEIEVGSVTAVAGATLRYGEVDTEGGSSGSGVLSGDTGMIVGVHTNAGCNAAGGSNRGVPISAIINESDLVRSLVWRCAEAGGVADKYLSAGGTVSSGSTQFRQDACGESFVVDIGKAGSLSTYYANTITTMPYAETLCDLTYAWVHMWETLSNGTQRLRGAYFVDYEWNSSVGRCVSTREGMIPSQSMFDSRKVRVVISANSWGWFGYPVWKVGNFRAYIKGPIRF